MASRILDYLDPFGDVAKADERFDYARRVERRSRRVLEQQLSRYWRDIARSAQDAAVDWLRPADAVDWANRSPWGPDVERELGEAYREMVAQSFPTAGQAALERLGLSSAVNFALDNPYAQRYAADASAEFLAYLGSETQLEIRAIIGRGFRLGRTVRDMGREIRTQVGVQSRHLALLERMAEDGADEVDIARRATRLRNYRAETIARTEAITSFARGTQASWQAASDQGLFAGQDAKQRWIASPGSIRTCKICRSLHGKTARLGGSWQTIKGRTVRGPPAHPACRCAVGLVVG